MNENPYEQVHRWFLKAAYAVVVPLETLLGHDWRKWR